MVYSHIQWMPFTGQVLSQLFVPTRLSLSFEDEWWLPCCEPVGSSLLPASQRQWSVQSGKPMLVRGYMMAHKSCITTQLGYFCNEVSACSQFVTNTLWKQRNNVPMLLPYKHNYVISNTLQVSIIFGLSQQTLLRR